MNLKRVSAWAAFAVLGALNLTALAQAPNQPPKKEPPQPPAAQPPAPTTPPAQSMMVGKPAPEFVAKDLDGREHKLSGKKGKIVVLEWLSSNCTYCKTHLKDKKTMQNTFKEFKDKDVIWLGVASNASEVANTEDLKKFAKDMDVNYPILVDTDGRIAQAFNARTTPHMFVIDKGGLIAYEGAIDSDPTMKDPKATNYVEQALQAVVDGSQVVTASSKPYGSAIKLGPAGGATKERQKEKEKGPGTGKP